MTSTFVIFEIECCVCIFELAIQIYNNNCSTVQSKRLETNQARDVVRNQTFLPADMLSGMQLVGARSQDRSAGSPAVEKVGVQLPQ